MAQEYGEFRSFPSTHWSLVAGAGQDDAEARRQALGELLVRYLPALRAHLVRKKRIRRDPAEELLHEFLAKKVVEKELVSRADRTKGKFRTFLLTALDRFVANQMRDAAAKKRRPADGNIVNIDDQADPVGSDDDPAGAFDAAWATQVISQAVQRMQAECRASGRTDIWGVFACRLLDPTLAGAKPMPYDALVERFGLASPAQASNVLISGKRMFERNLRAVVAEYIADEDEVDAEITELRQILSRGRA
jgi:RNA polymerase sigma-70 factor (ECF subfamily)